MAIIRVTAHSTALAKSKDFIVIQPEVAGPLPVVYLLHGMSDDCTTWLRRSQVELHAERLGLMIVLVDGDLGFYTDVPGTDRRYESHVLETVVRVDRTFATKAEARFRGIGGNSMGGYGALKLALKHPDVFGSATPHSGVLDIAAWVREDPHAPLRDAFPGKRVPASDNIFTLARRPGPKPRIRIDCGESDYLLEHNRRTHDVLTRAEVEHLYLESPGGHSWEYWNAQIGDALDFHAGCFARKVSRRKS